MSNIYLRRCGGFLRGYGEVVFATHSCRVYFTQGVRYACSRTSSMRVVCPIRGSHLSIWTIPVRARMDAPAFFASVRHSWMLSEHNLTHPADLLPIGSMDGFSEVRYRNIHSHCRSSTVRLVLCHPKSACSSVSDLHNSHNARSYNTTAFDTLQIQFSEAAYKDARAQHPHPVLLPVLNPLPTACTVDNHTHTSPHELTRPQHTVLHPVSTPSRRDCR